MSQTVKTHKLAVTAILSAAAAILMFLSFPIPFLIPSFVKMDFSELPALLAAFSLGPVSGVAVCLVKNVINVFFSTTGGVGELCNFLLGVCLVVPAGLIYRAKRTRGGALAGALLGSAAMAVCSVPINYFISYPFYVRSGMMSMEAIMDAYQLILPSVQTLPQALLIFNIPFTLVKAACDVAITFAVYKRISPLIHGQGKRLQA